MEKCTTANDDLKKQNTEKRKIDNGDDGDDNLKKQKINSENENVEQELYTEMEKYTTDVIFDEEIGDADQNHELKEYKNINYKLYQRKGFLYIGLPIDKYKSYMKMTEIFGYEFNKTNEFLRSGGIVDVLHIERPFFCFWEHGLDLYFHKMDISSEKYKKFLFRRKHCAQHEFQCPNSVKPGEKPCNLVKECIGSDSFTYFFSGILRSRANNAKNKTFTSYSIQLDNCYKIESANYFVSNTLTIKNVFCNISLLNKCEHVDCGLGVNPAPIFEGMPPTYKMCSKITKLNELKPTFDMKRVYAYGKGISGNIHESSNTIYLSTWNLNDLFIVNY